MNATRNTLSASTRKKAVTLPNHTVADLFDLYARTKQAHWNLRGQSFFALHKLLDEFAGITQEDIDSAAERATALGGIVDQETHRRRRLRDRRSPYRRGARPGQATLDSRSALGQKVTLLSTQP